MTSLEEKARDAAAARARMQQSLLACSTILAQVAEVMNASAVELAEATQREVEASQMYISALEAELSRQQTVS